MTEITRILRQRLKWGCPTGPGNFAVNMDLFTQKSFAVGEAALFIVFEIRSCFAQTIYPIRREISRAAEQTAVIVRSSISPVRLSADPLALMAAMGTPRKS